VLWTKNTHAFYLFVFFVLCRSNLQNLTECTCAGSTCAGKREMSTSFPCSHLLFEFLSAPPLTSDVHRSRCIWSMRTASMDIPFCGLLVARLFRGFDSAHNEVFSSLHPWFASEISRFYEIYTLNLNSPTRDIISLSLFIKQIRK